MYSDVSFAFEFCDLNLMKPAQAGQDSFLYLVFKLSQDLFTTFRELLACILPPEEPKAVLLEDTPGDSKKHLVSVSRLD